jgi:hypothetical protein
MKSDALEPRGRSGANERIQIGEMASRTDSSVRMIGTDQPSEIMTVDEVADWLRVSRGWLLDHSSGRRRPLIPCIKLGRQVRYRRSDVLRAVEALSQNRLNQ